MFAIFMHESMNPFHQTVTSFPTVIFTGLLIVCLLYWVVAVLGLVDIDILDIDYDGDIDSADSAQMQTGISGLLLRLGLSGVPLTIIITLVAMFGWLICYYASYLLTPLIPTDVLKGVASLGIFCTATYLSVMITAQIIKPVRKLFHKLDIDETKHILGQTVIVRSAIVDAKRGEGFMDDGGAGLLLNIRATGTQSFVKGDAVVPIEALNEGSMYRVIAESEFNG